MTRLRVALVAATLVLAAAPAAQAHPTYHYTGECEFSTISDGTDGPDTVWTGYVRADVEATDELRLPGAVVPISVECVLVNMTAGTEQTVLSASGVGVAAGAGPLVYEADPDDVVTMCWHVSVGGESHIECPGPVTTELWTTKPVEQQYRYADPIVCREIGKAAPGVPGIVDVTPAGDVYVGGRQVKECSSHELLRQVDLLLLQMDLVVCGELRRAAPGAPPAVEIQPDGDLYVAGEWVWECPPYEW